MRIPSQPPTRDELLQWAKESDDRAIAAEVDVKYHKDAAATYRRRASLVGRDGTKCSFGPWPYRPEA